MICTFERSDSHSPEASYRPLNYKSTNWIITALVLLVFLFGSGTSAQAQTASYSGITSSIDTTHFTAPQGIVTDASGNLFVADNAATPTVYEMTRTGPGTYGTPVALPGPTAAYSFLRGVAIDSSGNLWVADFANYPATAGQVYELVYNSGTQTFAAPVAVGSGWQSPWALTADTAGNIFVSDNSANTISKISGGTVTVLNTGGVTTPRGMAVDANDNLYVVDGNLGRVMELAAPAYTTVTSVNSTGFQGPGDIALDASGNIWVSEYSSNFVRELTFGSNYATVLTWGSGLNGPLAVWPNADGTLLVSDFSDHAIKQIAIQPINLGTFALGSTSGSQTVTFTFTGVASTTIQAPVVVTQGATGQDFADAGTGSCSTTNGSGNPYATNTQCSVVVTFQPKHPGLRYGAVTLLDTAGNLLAEELLYGTGTGPEAVFSPGIATTPVTGFSSPQKVAVDGSGNTFIADPGANAIYEIPAGGGARTAIATGHSFSVPYGIAIDGAGNLFVTETGANHIDEVFAAGGYTTVRTLSPTFAGPVGLAVDASGNVYLADASSTNKVEELTAASDYGVVRTLGSFTRPFGVAVDASGNVFVADEGSTSITELVAVNGQVPASPTTHTYGAFTSPAAVAVDSAGDLYVADNGGGTISELTAGSNYATSLTLATGVSDPAGVAVDSSGNVSYSTNGSDNSVHGIDLADAPTLTFQSSAYQTPSADSPKSMTIGNIGSGAGSDLNFSGLSITTTTANAANSFAQVAGTGTPADCSASSTLASGSSCNLSVSFTPQYAEAIAGTATLTDNTLGVTGTIQTINLSGTGTQAAPTLAWANPANITYGTTLAGVLNATAANGTNTVAGTFAYTAQLNGGGTPAPVTTTTVLTPGTYTLTVSFTPTDTNNFSTPSAVQVSLTVDKAVLTVTGNNASRTYGTANPTFTASITGFVNGDTQATATTGAPSLTTTATTASAAGTYAITAAVGSLAATNYTFTFVDGTLTIGQATLTVTAANASRTYGAANPALSATITGFVNGDTQATATTGAPSLTTTATTASPVGNYPITAAVGTLASTNYTFTFVNGTLTVGQATLTVTAANASRTYGAANPAISATITGFVNGDTQATATTGAPSLTTTATTASPVGNYPITAAVGTLASTNYTFTFVDGTLTVGQATLTVTAANASRTYGAANPVLSATITGFVNGDTQATATTGAPSLATTATTASPVGNYPITAAVGTLASTNYTFTFVNGTLTVSQATLTVTAANASRTYGTANPALSATITGFVNGDTQGTATTGAPSLTTAATTASPVGTYPIIAAAGTLASTNYTFTFVNGTLTIGQATLTVTANNASRSYGAANPTFSATMTGFVNGDTQATATTGAPSLTTTATTASAVGTYPITAAAGTLASTNYTFTFVNGTLTVGQATLTVTANNASRAYGVANPAFTAAITGFVNGDGPSVVTGSPVFSTTATTASPVGSYPIIPSSGTLAASNYTFTFVNGTLTIGQATPTITWATPASITYGTPLSSAQLNASSTVGGTFVYTPAAGTVLNAGAGQTLSVTLNPTDATDYGSTTATVAITVNVATPTITFAVPNHAYGDAPFAVSATSNSTGAISYSVVSGPAAVSGSTVTLTGAGAVTLQASQSAAGNYGAGTQTATFTVAPATATLAFAAIPAQTYGNTPFTVSASSSSNGTITYSILSGPATVNAGTGMVTLTGAGTVAIEASQAATSGYTASMAQTTIAVAKQASKTAVTASSTSINPNQSVTLTATVTPAVLGTPSGTVTFFTGTTQLGSPVTLSNGTAQLAVTSLTSGSDAISATYNGDANFGGSTGSLSGDITVAPLAFTMSASPALLTGAPGTTFNYALNVTPTYGAYPGTVTFSASGLPAGATATFSPSSIAANGGTQTVTLAVATSANTASVQMLPVNRKLAPLALALLLLPLAGTRRMRRQGRRLSQFVCLLLLAFAGLAVTAALSGCGSTGFHQTQNYTVIVTATSGNVQQTSTVTLTLQ